MRLTFVDNLRGGMIVAKDITARDSQKPLVRSDSILTSQSIEQLKWHDVRFVYIHEHLTTGGGYDELQASSSLYVPEPKPVIEPKLREDAIVSLRDVFEDVTLSAQDVHTSSAQVVKQLDTVVHQLVDALLAEKGALVNISDLKSYDEYTFHHSLSVAVLSITMGQKLGYDQSGLYQLGLAAMMHDIGKTAIPIEVTNKTGKLDDQEFAMMKNHSPAGYEQLALTGIGDEDLWRSVLFHHEKVDGSGYPYGLSQDEIPLSSRIMAVADVYDALTSDRPYRTPVQPGEALEYIMGSVGTMFDFDMVSAFVNRIELYPVGSYVELSDGNVAVVLKNENPLRPIVRVTNNNEVWDLQRDRKCLSVVVRRQLHMSKL